MKARLIILSPNSEYQPPDPYMVVESDNHHLSVLHRLDAYYLTRKPIESLTPDDLTPLHVRGAVLSGVRELMNDDLFSEEFREEVRQWYADFLREIRETQRTSSFLAE